MCETGVYDLIDDMDDMDDCPGGGGPADGAGLRPNGEYTGLAVSRWGSGGAVVVVVAAAAGLTRLGAGGSSLRSAMRLDVLRGSAAIWRDTGVGVGVEGGGSGALPG